MSGSPLGGASLGDYGQFGTNYAISIGGSLTGFTGALTTGIGWAVGGAGSMSGFAGAVTNSATFGISVAGSMSGLSGAVSIAANFLVSTAGSLSGFTGAISHVYTQFFHQRVRLMGGVIRRTVAEGSGFIRRHVILGGRI